MGIFLGMVVGVIIVGVVFGDKMLLLLDIINLVVFVIKVNIFKYIYLMMWMMIFVLIIGLLVWFIVGF